MLGGHKLHCRCSSDRVMLTACTATGAGTKANRCHHNMHTEAAALDFLQYVTSHYMDNSLGIEAHSCSLLLHCSLMQSSNVILLQVPSKESLPSDEELAKEVISVLSGVNVLEFNIKMLMKHLSKHSAALLVPSS